MGRHWDGQLGSWRFGFFFFYYFPPFGMGRLITSSAMFSFREGIDRHPHWYWSDSLEPSQTPVPGARSPMEMQILSQPEIADIFFCHYAGCAGNTCVPLMQKNSRIPPYSGTTLNPNYTCRPDSKSSEVNTGIGFGHEGMAAVYASIIARFCDRGLWFIVCSPRRSPHSAFIPLFLPCAFLVYLESTRPLSALEWIRVLVQKR
jgi:hypothetical protein